MGPYRVWNDQGFPGLAMARSMGDFQFHCIGISNTPEITQHIFTEYLINIAMTAFWFGVQMVFIST